MVMVGAGALAPFLIRAHLSQRPIDEVAAVEPPARDRADALADELASRGPARPGDATTSRRGAGGRPRLLRDAVADARWCKGEWLKPGAHLDLVGAFNLRMREADDEALRAAQVYVDTPAARREGGDVALALRDGAIAPDHVLGDLFDLCRGAGAASGTRPSPCSSRWARRSRISLRRCWSGAARPDRRRRSLDAWIAIVKICGLSTPETLDAALEAGADLVGFVHFPRSPRHVDLETGRALSARARGRAQRVVLLVDPDDAALAAVVAALDPDLLQLHGHETPERVAAIRARFGRPVMKAIGVAAAADLARPPRYAGRRRPPPARRQAARHAPRPCPGGNGLPFDWRLLAGLDPGSLTLPSVHAVRRARTPTTWPTAIAADAAPGPSTSRRASRAGRA